MGDVCMVQYLNDKRGNWRLCKVVRTHPAENNVVRNVDVEVSARYDGSLTFKRKAPYTLSRHVSKLIVNATIEEEEDEDLDKTFLQHPLYLRYHHFIIILFTITIFIIYLWEASIPKYKLLVSSLVLATPCL